MLNVSAETKALLKSDSVYKEMTVVLTASNHLTYTYHNEDIYYESFELSESIIDGSDMTVMGCISSEMRITLRNVDNLKENAFDESPITVTMVPYETTRSKNLMPPLYGAGYSDTQNGITFVVNDDLSVTFTGIATANTTIELAHYRVLDAKNTYVSGCPSGTEGVKQGKFTLIRGAFETYYDDLGSDVYIQTQANDICSYAAYFASGQTVNMTFYPMMRLTTQSNTYEAYGEKYVARDQITLFTGYVDSGQYNNDRGWIKITAYDALYHHQSTKCWNWYRSAFGSNGGTARGLRTLMISLFDWLETHDDGYRMDYNSSKTPVILNAVKIKRRLNNKEMTVTDFLKSLCQLNCGFGIVGRNGEFEIRYLNSTDSGTETITYYRGLTEKDYVAVPFDEGITIITNSDDNGVTLDEPSGQIPTPDWDDDTNDNYVVVSDDSVDIFTGKYFITNNGLVKKLSAAKRRKILDILLTNVQTPTYTIDGVTYPCYRFKSHKLECNGLPYLECGDVIIYKPDQSTPAKPFVIANRKLKGIQAMVDTFSLELPNTLKTYGGETSKKKDSNIESEGSTTNLTTGSFIENGTYSAYDYDAMGFSSVTVNVSGGGGGPQGDTKNGRAIGYIPALSTVHIVEATGATPKVVNVSANLPSIIDSRDAQMTRAGDYVYFTKGSSTTIVYRVPYDNLAATPEVYYDTTDTSVSEGSGVNYLARGLLNRYQKINGANRRYIKNLLNNIEEEATVTYGGWYGYSFTKDHGYAYSKSKGKWSIIRIIDLYASGINMGASHRALNDIDHVWLQNTTKYSVVIGGTQTDYTFNETVYATGSNIIGNYLIHYSASYTENGSTYYDLCYTQLGTTTVNRFMVNGEKVRLKHSSTLASSNANYFLKWNDAGTKLGVLLVQNGIALIDTSLNVTWIKETVDHVAITTYASESNWSMFGDYIYLSWNQLLYKISTETTIEATSSKNAAGSLGYVQQAIPADQIGTAIILFS